MRFALLNVFACLSVAAAFRPAGIVSRGAVLSRPVKMQSNDVEKFQPFDFEVDESNINSAAIVPLLAVGLMFPADAHANEYGILAGKTASLLHPFTMLALFATSLYSGYLGLQWRRLRGIGEEIKDVSKQLPVLSSGQAKYPISDSVKEINAKITSLTGAENSDSAIATLNRDHALLMTSSSVAADSKIRELSATRKDLLSMNLKDKHTTTGSWLLGAGVSVSLLGAFNTYMRAGKLFPGPHLYAGMAVTILWAVAASLVPAMQKGNEAARAGHIALNTVNVVLFAWQVGTGLEILAKVWEKTSWP